MTITCVRCGGIIFRYAPVDETMDGLCDPCALERANEERARLTCGRDECLLVVGERLCDHDVRGECDDRGLVVSAKLIDQSPSFDLCLLQRRSRHAAADIEGQNDCDADPGVARRPQRRKRQGLPAQSGRKVVLHEAGQRLAILVKGSQRSFNGRPSLGRDYRDLQRFRLSGRCEA